MPVGSPTVRPFGPYERLVVLNLSFKGLNAWVLDDVTTGRRAPDFLDGSFISQVPVGALSDH